jgi:hypothetical protein
MIVDILQLFSEPKITGRSKIYHGGGDEGEEVAYGTADNHGQLEFYWLRGV